MKLHTVMWYGSSSEEEVEIEIEAENITDALDKAVNLHRYKSHSLIQVRDGSFFGRETYANPKYTRVEEDKDVDTTSLTPSLSNMLSESTASIKEQTASIKQSLNSLKLPKVEFQDSGWILLYRIAGWISIIVGIVVLFVGLVSDSGNSSEEGFVFFFCALLAALANFFAAHILRLQEKTAAFTETTSEIMVKHHELMVENVSLLRSIAQKTENKGE